MENTRPLFVVLLQHCKKPAIQLASRLVRIHDLSMTRLPREHLDLRRPPRRALCAMCSVMLVSLCQAETVYDNSHAYEEKFYPTPNEFGDELYLSGQARIVTELRFEYFGDFTAEGDERAVVRFYRNDGPGEYPTPGTLIFKSDPIVIHPGLNMVVLRDLSVEVPEPFTWTVQFEGLLGRLRDKAGLTMFDPPANGFSYDDFWMKREEEWKLYRISGPWKSNFGVRIEAQPDPHIEVLQSGQQADGRFEMRFTGPLGRSFLVERSTDMRNWAPVASGVFQGRPFSVGNPPTTTELYYRARLLPETEGRFLSVEKINDHRMELTAIGPAKRYFALEESKDLGTWTPWRTNLFTTGTTEISDWRLKEVDGRFFRTRLLPEVPMVVRLIEPLEDGGFLLQTQGPRGKDFLIERTSDFLQWERVATNVFSFADGRHDYYSEGDPAEYVFYRIREWP